MSDLDFGVQFELGPDDVRVETDSSVYYVRVVERGESLAGVGVSGLEGMVVAAVVALVTLVAGWFRGGRRSDQPRLKVGVVRLSRAGAGSVRVIRKEKVAGRAEALLRVADLTADVRRGKVR